MNFAIRPAEPADAAALKRLGDEVSAEPEGWLATAEWRSAGDERRYLRDQHAASRHVADVGLMVGREHRRRGFGRAVLAAAAEWARTHDVRKLELHVFPYNEAAIRLYEECGFVREGYRRRHYRRGDEYVDAILMAYHVEASGRARDA